MLACNDQSGLFFSDGKCHYSEFCVKMSSIAETNTSPITFAKSVSTLLADRKYGEIVHILCLKGVLSFLFQETLYNVGPNDYVILPNVRLARSFNESSDFEGIVMALDERFVTGLALRSNYGVIGQLALLQNPVMKLSSEIALRCAEDLRRLNERLHDRVHEFLAETADPEGYFDIRFRVRRRLFGAARKDGEQHRTGQQQREDFFAKFH